MKINGSVVWITGASSGLGEALANELNSRGAELIISSRRTDELERVKSNLPNTSLNCHIISFDLTNPNEIKTAVDKALSKVKRIDILINNGGTSQRSYAEETDMSVYRKLMELNFFGAVELTKALLPIMISQKCGQITAISSFAGKYGFPLRTGYCASKHAMQGFFESLRAEVKKHSIKVLIVSPGRIDTNISYNALTKDGSPQKVHESSHESALSPQYCAKRIVNSIICDKRELLIGKGEKVLFYFRKYCAPLFHYIVDKVKPN